jgi:hypothetical protein
MKLNKLQVSVLSVILTGLLQCSYSWAAGAAGGAAGAAGAGTVGAGSPAGTTGGATNGTVGNGATTNGVSPNGATPNAPGAGATGTGNPAVTPPARPTVNPNQPASPTGQDLNPTTNPGSKDMNRVDPNTRDTRARNSMNNSTTTVPPVPNNGCYSVAGQPTSGGSDCVPTGATPR